MDALAHEDFIRLPDPCSNIIIASPHDSDVQPMVTILNNPTVYKWLDSAVHPFTESLALQRIERARKSSHSLMENLRHLDRHFVGGCPVNCIREILSDGTQVYIGDITVKRSKFTHILDKSERDALTAENEAKEAGDPTIVWAIAFYLASSHHGRGIMSTAVRVLLREWLIPKMNVHVIRTEVFLGNLGSTNHLERSILDYSS
ncbi:hypothetical protein ABKN59_011361 [Abortiporus biennis]